MKKLSYIVLFVLMVMSVFSKPIITIENNYINLGELPQETRKSFSIIVKNSGNSELLIKNIHAPCGCTTPYFDSPHIPPDGKAEIDVTFDTGNFINEVQKYIEIISNDKDRPYYKVFFEVNIYQEFIASPPGWDFNTIIRRLGKKAEISIKHYKDKEFAIESVAYDKKIFDLSWKPVRQEDLFWMDVILKVKPGIIINQLKEKIRFSLKSDGIKSFTLPASSVILDEDLLFDTGIVRFVKNDKDVEVLLKNYSGSPFSIKEIKKNNNNFQVRYDKISGNSYQLHFVLMNTKENFFDTVTIVTDILEEKEKILRIVY